jgi:hypothetical protein
MTLGEYLPTILAVISLVVWSIRLEGRVNSHEKEIDSLNDRLTSFDSKLLSKLSEIAERLSFIEGSLKADAKK